MNQELIIVLALLASAILMFAINRPRPDMVALMMMLVLPFTGVISIGEAIAGFSNANIVLIGAMFVVGEALARTGVAKRVGDWLADRGGRHGWLLTLLIMLAVGLLGAFMSSTGVVAIFIPVVLRIAARTGMACELDGLDLFNGDFGPSADGLRLTSRGGLRIELDHVEADVQWRSLLSGRVDISTLTVKSGRIRWQPTPGSEPTGSSTPVPSVTNSGQIRSAGVRMVSR